MRHGDDRRGNRFVVRIGRQVADVAATLKGLGLTVRTAGAESDAEFGTVLAVRPTTGLRQGDTVTVTYSLGGHEGGNTPFGFDVTDLLKDGANSLAFFSGDLLVWAVPVTP